MPKFEPQNQTAVIGEGWAAIAIVGFLVQRGVPVTWITGSRARLFPPLFSLEGGSGVGVWAQLCALLGIECGDPQIGVFTHQYRNKSFQSPSWLKAASDEEQSEIRKGVLWGPEQKFMGTSEAKFEMPVAEIEEKIRQLVSSELFVHLSEIKGVPVQAIESDEEGRIQGVLLGSGEKVPCSQLFYADQWKLLSTIEGLPRPLSFLRKREPTGLLQVSFQHRASIGAPLGSPAVNYFFPLSKEAGQERERHVWGYLSEEGKKSVWSLCLSPEEIEDNHEILKKLKRLKTALEKSFSGFLETVETEQVRFHEEGFFADSEVLDQPAVLPSLQGAFFLTDGYGLTCALQQAKEALTLALRGSHSESEDVNLLNTGTA